MVLKYLIIGIFLICGWLLGLRAGELLALPREPGLRRFSGLGTAFTSLGLLAVAVYLAAL